MDESAQFQELREDDNSASEITYGEVEQRLGQLQEHLNRSAPPPTTAHAHRVQQGNALTCEVLKPVCGKRLGFFFNTGSRHFIASVLPASDNSC